MPAVVAIFDIALSCKDLFVKNSLKDLTISKIATTAGISKGSIYDYFKNKEEIVFELINILMQEHDEKKQNKLSQASSTKDKIKIFSDFFYNKEDAELRELYKDFISINLTTPNEQMIEFQTDCFNKYHLWMDEIIQEGINKGELIVQSKDITKGLFAIGEGLFLASVTTNAVVDLEKEINNHIDTIFTLIEVKK
jgi:AcrR family transcriptional regulator